MYNNVFELLSVGMYIAIQNECELHFGQIQANTLHGEFVNANEIHHGAC